jgi:hypothetical protein
MVLEREERCFLLSSNRFHNLLLKNYVLTNVCLTYQIREINVYKI